MSASTPRVETDPRTWRIVDGKLQPFSSIKAREMADGDPTVLARAPAGFQRKK